MSDKDEARESAGADITDNRNADMAPKGSDALPSRKEGGSDADQEIAGTGRDQADEGREQGKGKGQSQGQEKPEDDGGPPGDMRQG